MTGAQMQAKLALMALDLQATVTVEEFLNEDDVPCLRLEYALPGGGNMIEIPQAHSDSNLRDVAHNLPLAADRRLAAVAILVQPIVVNP